MVRLHLLGFTNDLKGVVFSRKKGGKTAAFWVPIDGAFMSAVEKLERARRDREGADEAPDRILQLPDEEPITGRKAPPARRSERAMLPAIGRSEMSSAIPPSEIQKLIREGKSVEVVAKTAKAPRAWVERLAEPVFAERSGVVRLAQRAFMPRPRLGRSGLPLAQAVQLNLQERRATAATLETIDEGWDARASRAGHWRVRLRFTHRGSRRLAEWDFVKSTRQISPRNRLAAELGWWPAPDEPRPPPPESAEEEGADEPPPKPKPRSRKPKAKKRAPATRPRKRRAAPKRRRARR